MAVLELERPGEHPSIFVLDRSARRTFLTTPACNRRIERAVAVALLRIFVAGQAAQPSGSYSLRTIGSFWYSGNEATISLPFATSRAVRWRSAHAHVALDNVGRALGVIGDEIERRAGLAGGAVRAVGAMFEKLTQDTRRPWLWPGWWCRDRRRARLGSARFTASAV